MYGLIRLKHDLGSLCSDGSSNPVDVVLAVEDGAAHVAVRPSLLVLVHRLHQVADFGEEVRVVGRLVKYQVP